MIEEASFVVGSHPGVPGYRGPQFQTDVFCNGKKVPNFVYANIARGIVMFKHDPKQTILSRKTGFVYVQLRKAD